jgi:diguanylate cyclase (GGDEF)-like protein
MVHAVSILKLKRTSSFRPSVPALTLALLFVAPIDAAPQSPRVSHLSVDDGLSQSSVVQILEDRHGLLWFGTQEGLNRYDGYRFTVHRAREQQGFLGDHDITALIQGEQGELWVGTSRGLYRYDLDTGRFDRCASPIDQLGIPDLIQGGDGRIFFTASDGRLWMLDPADATRRAQRVTGTTSSALTGVTALAPADGTAIWAAASGGLFKVDATRADPVARVTGGLRDLGAVSAMVTDRSGDVWIGRAGAELLRYRPRDGRVDRFPQAPRNVLTLLPGRSGEIWIGARAGGLSRLEPASGDLTVYRHDPEDPSSLSSDDVAALYQDRVGNIWIGTWNGGVNRLDPRAQAFRTLRHRPRVADSLPADDISAMTETPDGDLWLASRGGIVAAGSPRSGRFRTVATIRDKGRLATLASWDERMLVGTSRGLIALELQSGRPVALGAPFDAHHLSDRPIGAIRSAPGLVWIASGKDLFRVVRPAVQDPVRVDRIELPVAGSVSALSTGAAGPVWIGSDRGEVVRAEWSDPVSGPVVRRLDVAGPLRESLARHGLISALHEDRQGRLWVGTRRGLGRIENESGDVTWLGQPDGLPSTNVAGIAGDADGRLWIGHNRGLTRIDPANGAMTHFGEREGAQGSGYAEGSWAGGGSGLIYFAGEGVTVFDPRDVSLNSYPPRIVFTALEILHRVVAPKWLDPDSPLDRTIAAQGEVTLPPSATAFSLEMAPVHYVDPPSNRLMYWLEGFDPAWIETDAHNRVASYTNLPPGRYVLHARAGTKNDLWSEREATLAITILPPWWRTRAALVAWCAMTLVVVGLVWTAARRRARVRLALRERETLRRESLTDPLTGLYNRRFLVTYLQHEVPKLLRDYRANGPAAAGSANDLLLLLLDVDHFKTINDRHSHAVGDRVLSQIARVLREQIRDSDLAVRWGGDEFLVVARSFQRDRAAEHAERLREAVAALGGTLAGEGGPRCTLSIGFSVFPFLPREPDALSWEQTLDLADHALRLTKLRQRNSYTGLRAGAALTGSSVRAFLAASRGAPLPEGMELLIPEAVSAREGC